MSYEENFVPNTDNHYNCPVVANYPVVIGANMPELREEGVRYMRPYFNMANHELMVDRIVEEFAWANVTRGGSRNRGQGRLRRKNEVFKHDVQMEGLKALAYMKEHDCKGIVLAGRPYHVDPEINHGIPETICALGMVVLSEDSICELQPGEKLNLKRIPRRRRRGSAQEERERLPPRRRPQGHQDAIARHQPVGLPCASVRGGQLRRILSGTRSSCSSTPSAAASTPSPPTRCPRSLADKAADVYTMLKIDEVLNLGAAKIRLRSLKAAVEERERNKKNDGFRKTGTEAPTPGRQVMLDTVMKANPKLTEAVTAASKRAAENGKGESQETAKTQTNGKGASAHNSATLSKYANRIPFGKNMKDYTIVAPQMSPIHFSLVESVIRSGGYKFDILEHASREDVETGLKYVNNDACYPAIMVIGQLVDAILEGKYDPDHTALAITQTGGMCRATNYFGLIRKALVDAGYPQIPVIAISTQGIEDNPGFTATPALLHRAIKALIVGDLLMKCLYRVRPYEVDTRQREPAVQDVGHHRARDAREPRSFQDGTQVHRANTCRIRRSSRRSSSRSTRCR